MRPRRVADNGASEDQPRTSAYSLEKAREHEGMGVGSEKPGDARNREYGEANQQHRPAAKAIGRRPVDQLADSQSQDVETCVYRAQVRSGSIKRLVFWRIVP